MCSPGAEGRQRHVGQIRTTITLENREDLSLASAGLREVADVRRAVVEEAVVDTATNGLGVPRSMITQLGLRPVRTVEVATPDGGVRAGSVFEELELTIGPRSHPFACVELPEGQESLVLGWLPLQALGREVDVGNHEIIVLPDTGPDTYLRV